MIEFDKEPYSATFAQCNKILLISYVRLVYKNVSSQRFLFELSDSEIPQSTTATLKMNIV